MRNFRPPFLLLLTILVNPAKQLYAQSDSLQVVNARWQTKKLAPGIVHKHYWFQNALFGASENVNIIDIKLNKRNCLSIAAEEKQLKPTSAFAISTGALAAINGTFFDIKNGGSVDYVRMADSVVNTTHMGSNNNRTYHQRSAIVIRQGRPYIAAWDGTAGWEASLKGEDVMVTGPMLLQNTSRSVLDSIAFNTARHPRSAIAIKGRHVLLITVDGRNERSAGVSLFELASLVKWLNADHAINLDGGGSTTLWIEGYPFNGVVNYPSDNKALAQTSAYKPGTDMDNLPADEKKWDHSG